MTVLDDDGERVDRGDHGCEDSVEGHTGGLVQILAVEAAVDDTPTEIGHRHVTYGDEVAGLPGQRSDRP